MRFHVLKSSLLPLVIMAIPDSHPQRIDPRKHSLPCPIFLGYFFKDFGNWQRESKYSALSSSTTSEDSDDDIGNNAQNSYKFILSNIEQKEKI